METWTVLRLLRWTTEFFQSKEIPSARRQAEELLGHVLELDRLHLYLQFEQVATANELAFFKQLVQRRAHGEPLQYLLGWQPFMGLKILTDSRALIPRPETEVLAEKAITWLNGRTKPARAADIGTGTGCLAFSLAALTGAEVFATDISDQALSLAKENATRLNLESRVTFMLGTGLKPLQERGIRNLDLLISNPPYIALGEKENLPIEVRDYEPSVALFAGPEGLEVLRPILQGGGEYLCSGGRLALECGLGQAARLKEEAEGKREWKTIWFEKDSQGKVRYLWAEKA